MSPIYEAAAEIHAFMKRRKWRFCLIGGVANLRWGEHRGTTDVDITLLTGFGQEAKFVEAILRHFRARTADACAFALQNRVILCEARNGVGLDISLGGLPYEERVIERASPFAFAPRKRWITASAEDMVVLKAFANRDQDWVDVKGILRRQTPNLDWRCIFDELDGLLKETEDWEIMTRLENLRREVDREIG